MKKHFTKLVLLIFTIAFVGQYSTAQTVIWGGPGDKNGEFDGGLNDWTVKSIEPDTTNFLWVWEADAKADQGTYSGLGSILFSPSASNGAAVFDSDFYDNSVQAAVQKAELISPSFSCANDTTVWLTFYQSFRTWHGVAKVAVSNDGGETWSPPYTINSELSVNESTKTNSVVFLNISQYAGAQEDVKVKFIWEDRYYFWIIDDVTILNGLNADPRISASWYPSQRYIIPQMQTKGTPMKFKMDVLNAGGQKDMKDIKATASIIKDFTEETIYSKNTIFNLSPRDTATIDFSTFTPDEMLDTGLYRAEYKIEYDNAASDFKKVVSHYFRVQEKQDEVWDNENRTLDFDNNFTFDDGGRVRGIGWQGGNTADAQIYFLSYYKTGDWVESDNISVQTVELNQRVGTLAGDGLTDFPFQMALFSVADTINDDFSNFANEENAGIFIDNVDNVNLNYLGSTDEVIESADEYEFLSKPIIDSDGENDYVVMHPNTKYLVSTFFDVSETVYYFVGYDNQGPSDDKFNSEKRYSYPEQVTALRYYPGANGGWTSYRSNYGSWMLGMKLHIAIVPPNATKDELLPNNTVQFANPVQEKLVADINFNKVIDHATIAIHNINGDIIEMRNIYNFKKDIQTFNTEALPAGTYIFTIFTKEKMLSKKFVVAK